MGFETLTTDEQTQLAQQLAEMMNAEDPSAYDASDLDTLFSQFDSYAWIRTPTPASNGLSAIDIFSQDVAGEGPNAEPTARETFTTLVTRRKVGEELATGEMFLLHSLAEGYGVEVGEDGLTQNQLELLETRLLAEESAPEIRQAFETARIEERAAASEAELQAAQEAEAAIDAAQGVLQVQAEMAALGLISPDQITGVWSPEHTDAFLEGTYTDVANGNRYNVEAIERIAEAKGFEGSGPDATTEVQQQVLAMLSESLSADGNGEYNIVPGEATQVMGIFMEGEDFTHIFEAALEGDENSIMMMQAITDQRIDGALNTNDLEAAMTYVRNNHPDNTTLITQIETALEEATIVAQQEATVEAAVEATVSVPEFDANGFVSPTVTIDTATIEAAAASSEAAAELGDIETALSDAEIAINAYEAEITQAELTLIEQNIQGFRTAGRENDIEVFQTGSAEEIADYLHSIQGNEVATYEAFYGTMIGNQFNGVNSPWFGFQQARKEIAVARQELEDVPPTPDVAPETPELDAGSESDLVAGYNPIDPGLMSAIQGDFRSGNTVMTGDEVRADPHVTGSVLAANYQGPASGAIEETQAVTRDAEAEYRLASGTGGISLSAS